MTCQRNDDVHAALRARHGRHQRCRRSAQAARRSGELDAWNLLLACGQERRMRERACSRAHCRKLESGKETVNNARYAREALATHLLVTGLFKTLATGTLEPFLDAARNARLESETFGTAVTHLSPLWRESRMADKNNRLSRRLVTSSLRNAGGDDAVRGF